MQRMKDTRPLYEAIVGGDLPGYLTRLRADGLTYEAIARRFHEEYGAEVTGSTVYRWCHKYGIEAPTERAS